MVGLSVFFTPGGNMNDVKAWSWIILAGLFCCAFGDLMFHNVKRVFSFLVQKLSRSKQEEHAELKAKNPSVLGNVYVLEEFRGNKRGY